MAWRCRACDGFGKDHLCVLIIMVNVIPPDHVDDVPVVEPNQHDDVPVVPEPVLVDEDEDPKEEEFEEEDDIEVDIEEDKNEPELTYPYEVLRYHVLGAYKYIRSFDLNILCLCLAVEVFLLCDLDINTAEFDAILVLDHADLFCCIQTTKETLTSRVYG
nr:hypothetical protein [Tanacetum cinerariifolium]